MKQTTNNYDELSQNIFISKHQLEIYSRANLSWKLQIPQKVGMLCVTITKNLSQEWRLKVNSRRESETTQKSICFVELLANLKILHLNVIENF